MWSDGGVQICTAVGQVPVCVSADGLIELCFDCHTVV